jgi:hypothetical protein
MARWMRVLLSGGRLPNGSRLYGESTARELTSVVTPMPVPEPPAELAALRPRQRGYALGLNVTDYRGHALVTHTGGLPGYVSRVALLPDEGVGVAVLTNQEAEEVHEAIAYSVLDEYLDLPRTDWVEAFARVRARREATFAAPARPAGPARGRGVRAVRPLSAYAGLYADAWYGDVRIHVEGGRLVVRFLPTPVLVGDAEPWDGDTFVVRWRDRSLRADAYLALSVSPGGLVERATMRAVSPDTDFSYDFQDLLLIPTRRK